MSRHRYPIEISRAFERSTISKLREALESSNELKEGEQIGVKEDGNNVLDVPKTKSGKKGGKVSVANKTGNDRGHGKQRVLKTILGEGLGYGPQLSEHMILDAGLSPSLKISKDNKLGEDKVQTLGEAVGRFEDWLENVIHGSKVPEGYIVMQAKKPGTTESENSSKVFLFLLPFEWIYDCPFE